MINLDRLPLVCPRPVKTVSVTVNALKSMTSKEVALRLDQIGRPTRTAYGVKKRQGRRQGGNRLSFRHGRYDNAAQCRYGFLQAFNECRSQYELFVWKTIADRALRLGWDAGCEQTVLLMSRALGSVLASLRGVESPSS